MKPRNPNKKHLNKLYSLKVMGKGAKGDFFGKINNVICFIADTKGEKIKYDEIIDVKIINVTPNCLFAEVVVYGSEEEKASGEV